MTGAELRAIRGQLSQAIGDRLSYRDMATLVGLADPTGNGKDTIRKWENGGGPSGPVAVYLSLVVEGLAPDQPDHVRVFFWRHVRDRIGIVPV